MRTPGRTPNAHTLNHRPRWRRPRPWHIGGAPKRATDGDRVRRLDRLTLLLNAKFGGQFRHDQITFFPRSANYVAAIGPTNLGVTDSPVAAHAWPATSEHARALRSNRVARAKS